MPLSKREVQEQMSREYGSRIDQMNAQTKQWAERRDIGKAKEFVGQVKESPEYQALHNQYQEYVSTLAALKNQYAEFGKEGSSITQADMEANTKKETDLQPAQQNYFYLEQCLDYIAGGSGKISKNAQKYWDRFMEANVRKDPETGKETYPFGLKNRDMESLKKEIEVQNRALNRQMTEQEKLKELQSVPGNIKYFMDYPGVDPTGKWERGDYEKYVQAKKQELESQLFGDTRPKTVDIAFGNLDKVILNAKAATVKEQNKDGKLLSSKELQDKVFSVLNERQTNETLKKYLQGTLQPFMDVAYREFEEKTSVSREHLLLVDGISVSSHLNRMGFHKGEKGYEQQVSVFVGTALQNGARVEAYIPDQNGKLPAERIQLNAEGYKMADMKFLKEGAWDKFCNFFGVTTQRQKHNAVVKNYYQNVENNRRWLESKLRDDMLGVREARESDQREKDLQEIGLDADMSDKYGSIPQLDREGLDNISFEDLWRLGRNPRLDENFEMNEAMAEEELDEDEGISWD